MWWHAFMICCIKRSCTQISEYGMSVCMRIGVWVVLTEMHSDASMSWAAHVHCCRVCVCETPQLMNTCTSDRMWGVCRGSHSRHWGITYNKHVCLEETRGNSRAWNQRARWRHRAEGKARAAETHMSSKPAKQIVLIWMMSTCVVDAVAWRAIHRKNASHMTRYP